MGVPKFFRFISERYPCISELIQKDVYMSDFDNLYLDMNGIIHMCSHPDDNNPHFRIDEKKIYEDIFAYITYLFQLISPKKLFFMAIDGVAPRAKMNQQRSRRFQTAREAHLLLEKAVANGEKVPEGKRFDSNCITPGTVFMARLHEQLQYFVKCKISSDRKWAQCKIILSGHETPGEGEHKIMDYIRYMRSQPDHDPNTRHCLYGLDADLIMLGFCTHEKNFSILREEVIFKKNVSRPTTPDQNNFYLLHLSLLRDYIEEEFSSLKSVLKFPFDMDKIIDDWILMGFLVGNDFIPNLPNLLINKNALPLLYNIYIDVLPQLDGYINENGTLNLSRFAIYMQNLAELDKTYFQEKYEDIKYLESKTGKSNKVEAKDADFDMISWNSDEEKKESDSSEDSFDTEFILHKKEYYMTKLEYENVTKDTLKSQAECYVRALQWILHYYYQGCCSWSWYYPFHYAPFLSDVTNFENTNLVYDKGQPFKPFEQLLGVLPVASKELLPEAFHKLMISEDSPIGHYYPLDFETDLNGKLQQWEAVVLLPFIDEKNLLDAMSSCYQSLTDEERGRNIHGPMLIYEYCTECTVVKAPVGAPGSLPSALESYALEMKMLPQDIFIPSDKVVYGALPNPYKDEYFHGVPTLKHIKFTTEFTKARVRVFEFPSRNESAILHVLTDNVEQSLENIASEYLGKIVWIGWPYIGEAKVVSVSNEKCKYTYIPKEKQSKLENDEILSVEKVDNKNQSTEFISERRVIQMHYITRLGISVDEVKILIHAVAIKGYKTVVSSEGKLIVGVDWCTIPVAYPLQTVLKNINVCSVSLPKCIRTVEEAFPVGDNIFVILGPYYGSMGVITDATEVSKTGRLKVLLSIESEPVVQIHDGIAIEFYYPSRLAAKKCGISDFLFHRITSAMFITSKSKSGDKKQDRIVNIGLKVKNIKSNEEVVGFTHKNDRMWLYSSRCIGAVTDYVWQFEDMFQNLEKALENETVHENDIFTNLDYDLGTVVEWVNSQPHNKYPARPCGTIRLDPEEMQSIRDTIESQKNEINKKKKKAGIKVKPHILFKESLRRGNVPPDTSNTIFDLFDRVVNISSSSSVPLGYKGTVVSVINKCKQNSVKMSETINPCPMYLVQFDEEFQSATTMEGVDGKRFYLMQGFNLLNITAGQATHCNNSKVQLSKLPKQNVKRFNEMPASPNSAFAQYNSANKTLVDAKHPNVFNKKIDISSNGVANNNTTWIPNNYPNQSTNYLNNSAPLIPIPLMIPPQLDDATQALRLLLNIDKINISNSGPPSAQNMNENKEIQSQEFYRTPHKILQPPYPAKFIESDNNLANCTQGGSKTIIKDVNKSDFVPLQVYKKLPSTHINNDNVCVEQNVLLPNFCEPVLEKNTCKPDIQVKNTAPKENGLGQKKRRRQRLAANFDNVKK